LCCKSNSYSRKCLHTATVLPGDRPCPRDSAPTHQSHAAGRGFAEGGFRRVSPNCTGLRRGIRGPSMRWVSQRITRPLCNEALNGAPPMIVQIKRFSVGVGTRTPGTLLAWFIPSGRREVSHANDRTLRFSPALQVSVSLNPLTSRPLTEAAEVRRVVDAKRISRQFRRHDIVIPANDITGTFQQVYLEIPGFFTLSLPYVL
jgi:hypothetical protein